VNNIPMRLRILIGLCVVLTPLVIWRIVLSGDPAPTIEPEVAAIQKDLDDGNIEGLVKKVKTYSPKHARRAVLALGHIGRKSLPALTRILLDDKRAGVRQQAALAMAKPIQASVPANKAITKQMTAALVAALATDEAPEVRAAAISVLGRVYDYENMDSLLKAMDDEDLNVRRRAYQAVTRIFGRKYLFNPTKSSAKRKVIIQEIDKAWQVYKSHVGDYRDTHRTPIK
jgi:HEAT repeat protein